MRAPNRISASVCAAITNSRPRVRRFQTTSSRGACFLGNRRWEKIMVSIRTGSAVIDRRHERVELFVAQLDWFHFNETCVGKLRL